MEANAKKRPVHVGHNIQKYRLFRGFSQASLAHQLENRLNRSISQQLISDIEDRETIQDEEVLSAIAEILDVPSEVLKALDFRYSYQHYRHFIYQSPTFTRRQSARDIQRADH